MKKLVIALAVAVVVLAVINIVQLNKKNEDMAVFDFARAIQESDAGKEAQSVVDNYEEVLAKQYLEPVYNELVRIQSYYQSNDKLSDKEKADLEAEFAQNQAEFEQMQQQIFMEIDELNTMLATQMVGELNETVAAVAKNKKLRMVVDLESFRYQELPDITDEIIAEYNIAYQKQKEELQAAEPEQN